MAEEQEADYMDPNTILFQHYQMGQRATGVTLGVGRRTTPDAASLFSRRQSPIQPEQFGSGRPSFTTAESPPPATTQV